MRVGRADTNDPVGDPDTGPTYRVRIWAPPPSAGWAWLMDEWDIFEARDVTDVISWAVETAGSGHCEVFVQWQDHHTDHQGKVVGYPRYTLVFGAPPDGVRAARVSVDMEAD